MMGRKKRILIIVLSIIVVLALIIGGVLAYLNYATDMFKSDEELFYKYAYQNASIFSVVDTNLLDRYYQKLNNNKYQDTAEISVQTGILEEATQIQPETITNGNTEQQVNQPVNNIDANTVSETTTDMNNINTETVNESVDQNTVIDQNTVTGAQTATETEPVQNVVPQADTAQFDTLMNNLKLNQ